MSEQYFTMDLLQYPPSHYGRYRARCWVDINASIKMQNTAYSVKGFVLTATSLNLKYHPPLIFTLQDDKQFLRFISKIHHSWQDRRFTTNQNYKIQVKLQGLTLIQEKLTCLKRPSLEEESLKHVLVSKGLFSSNQLVLNGRRRVITILLIKL